MSTTPSARSIERATVTVLVSLEVLDALKDWSTPVQVRIVETPGAAPGHEMEIRKVECEHE